jgi:hypothetical protein
MYIYLLKIENSGVLIHCASKWVRLCWQPTLQTMTEALPRERQCRKIHNQAPKKQNMTQEKKTFDADMIEVNQRRKFLQISTDLKRIRKSIIYKTNLNSIIYTSLYFSDVLYYSYRSNPRYLNCVTCGMIWPLTVTFKLEKCFILC